MGLFSFKRLIIFLFISWQTAPSRLSKCRQKPVYYQSKKIETDAKDSVIYQTTKSGLHGLGCL
jgi:hypothetical protein